MCLAQKFFMPEKGTKSSPVNYLTSISCDCQIYPDEGHFLSRQSRQHLYATLTSFYRECLKEELTPLPDEEEEEEE